MCISVMEAAILKRFTLVGCDDVILVRCKYNGDLSESQCIILNGKENGTCE